MQKSFTFLGLSLLSLLWIASCKHPEMVYHTKMTQYTFNKDSLAGNFQPALTFIQPFKDSLNKNMNFPLVYSQQVLSKELPEGKLGNYCADAILRQAIVKCKEMNLATPDFCFLNHGGLRAPLPQGIITIGNVYELMPFENELVYITVQSNIKDSILQWIAMKGGAPISGIRCKISGDAAKDVLILNDSNLTREKYNIITSDYLANGGDGLFILKTENKISLGIKVRDAFINDLKIIGDKKDSLFVQKDGRLTKI